MHDDTIADTLRVIYRRDPCGTVASLEIHAGDTVLLNTAEEDDTPGQGLARMLRVARNYHAADPYSDHLPPDDAVVAAYWDYYA